MKTDNIYFVDAKIVTDKKRLDTYSWTIYDLPLFDYEIYSRDFKKILVLYKTDKYGNNYVVNLNTKEKLGFEVPSEIGKIYIESKSLYPFNKVVQNNKPNLSKRKILKMGNPILNEINEEGNI